MSVIYLSHGIKQPSEACEGSVRYAFSYFATLARTLLIFILPPPACALAFPFAFAFIHARIFPGESVIPVPMVETED